MVDSTDITYHGDGQFCEEMDKFLFETPDKNPENTNTSEPDLNETSIETLEPSHEIKSEDNLDQTSNQNFTVDENSKEKTTTNVETADSECEKITSQEGVQLYSPEKIINHRIQGKSREYLIKWAGYDQSHNSWESLDIEDEHNIIHSNNWDRMLTQYRGRKGVPKSVLRDKMKAVLDRYVSSPRGEERLQQTTVNVMNTNMLFHYGQDHMEDDNVDPILDHDVNNLDNWNFTDTIDDFDINDPNNWYFEENQTTYECENTATMLHLKKIKKLKVGENVNGETTPAKIKDIENHQFKKEWNKSYQEELDSFQENGVFKVINRKDVPSGTRIHTLTPVFKIKTDQSGKTVRRKTRITLRGFNTRHGIEYDQTYAPTLQQCTFKTMMSIMTSKMLVGTAFDIKTAFLTAPPSHDVYCELPTGYLQTPDQSKVALCKKSIYGCKDASRNFYLAVKSKMENMGFKESRADPCLWTKGNMEQNTFIAVGLYVDDGTIVSSSAKLADEFLQDLSKRFNITIDPLSEMLGIRITKEENGNTTISQEKYITTMLEKHGFDCGSTNRGTHDTPLPTNMNGPPGFEETPLNAEDTNLFQQKMGSLIYAMGTRWDACYGISKLCRYMHAPTTLHMYWANHLFKYFRKHTAKGIQYQKDGDNILRGYCDASYCDDKTSGKSTVGYMITLNGGLIHFKSRLSKHVCTSTAMAEYVGMYECTRSIMLLRMLLEDLQVPQLDKTVIKCDNQSAIAIAEAEIPVSSHKHLHMRYHYTRECMDSIKIDYTDTTSQPADILTKPLAKPTFEKFVDQHMTME